MLFVVGFGIGGAKDDAGGADGKESAISDNSALSGGKLDVVNERTGVAIVIFQRVTQLSTFVAANSDGAVVQVDAGVNSLERCADGVALLMATDDIVAHAEWDDLFVVEHVLDDHDGAAALGIGLLVGVLVFLTVSQFTDADADGELLAAVRALEHERLTVSITGLVERNVVFAFRTSNAFHT